MPASTWGKDSAMRESCPGFPQGETSEPGEEARQRMDQQQNGEECATASETVVEGAAVSHTFQIAEAFLNLHPL